MDEDRVFKALADPTRRLLLDRLLERDGRSLTDLQTCVEMTRFGVMKHLRVLEDAGLVVSRRSGRAKLHYLDGRPLRRVRDRWLARYGPPCPDDGERHGPAERRGHGGERHGPGEGGGPPGPAGPGPGTAGHGPAGRG